MEDERKHDYVLHEAWFKLAKALNRVEKKKGINSRVVSLGCKSSESWLRIKNVKESKESDWD